MRAGIRERFDAFVAPEPMTGCWLWSGSDNGRYGLIRHDGKQRKAHRVAYELHRGAIPEGLVVMHKCDVTVCVNPDHLALGTQLDNIRDRDRKGRQVPNYPRGELNGQAKLKSSDVLIIRAMAGEGWKVGKIAQAFKVSHSMISAITAGKRWAHISGEQK